MKKFFEYTLIFIKIITFYIVFEKIFHKSKLRATTYYIFLTTIFVYIFRYQIFKILDLVYGFNLTERVIVDSLEIFIMNIFVFFILFYMGIFLRIIDLVFLLDWKSIASSIDILLNSINNFIYGIKDSIILLKNLNWRIFIVLFSIFLVLKLIGKSLKLVFKVFLIIFVVYIFYSFLVAIFFN